MMLMIPIFIGNSIFLWFLVTVEPHAFGMMKNNKEPKQVINI
jgi:uncharacterized membrane protein